MGSVALTLCVWKCDNKQLALLAINYDQRRVVPPRCGTSLSA